MTAETGDRQDRPLVVLTRPDFEQARPWMDALQAAGYSVCNIPLIAIKPLQQARAAVQRVAAARCGGGDTEQEDGDTGHMFVSAAAVRAMVELAGQEHFKALLHHPRQYWLAAGAGTMRAVRMAAAAVGADDGWQGRAVLPRSAAQYDSENLWAELEKNGLQRRLQHLCIYRGQDMQLAADGRQVLSAQQYSRDWFADTARAHGLAVQVLAVYQRSVPQQVQLPQPSEQPLVWVWSSSLALQNWLLLRCARQHTAEVAVCTHPRIAQNAAAVGFRSVHTCLPAPAELLNTLQRIA